MAEAYKTSDYFEISPIESIKFEGLTECEDLLSSIVSTKRQDVDFLVFASNDLLSRIKKFKPKNKSDILFSKWEIFIKRVTFVLSELQELNSHLLYNYSRILLISEDKDMKMVIILLERIIKASPQLIQAWNDLGDCYWEDGQVVQARDCFLGAIEHDINNKIGLRNLSIIYRQLCLHGSKQFSDNLQLSFQYAQRAVNCDKDDGISWMILGNSLLSEHFDSPKKNNCLLKKSLTCYRLAENDLKTKDSSDLYSNLGTVQICLEEFNDAIHSYSKALQLESHAYSLKTKFSSILSVFRTIQSVLTRARSQSIKKMSFSLNKISAKFDSEIFLQVDYSKLIPGENMNENYCINLFVEENIFQKELVPCILLCIETCGDNHIMCSIYGVKQVGVFSQGDIITIMSPVLKHKVIESECGISIYCPWISCVRSDYIRLNGKVLKNEYIMDAFIENKAFTNLD